MIVKRLIELKFVFQVRTRLSLAFYKDDKQEILPIYIRSYLFIDIVIIKITKSKLIPYINRK